MSSLEPVCAIAAGVLSGSCAIPYVRDIRRGTTRPHRVSWGIFTLLAGIAAASQLTNGWSAGALLSSGAALAFFAVFVMSMRHGVGGATVADRLTLLAAVGILAVWAWTGDGTVAVCLVIVLELIAIGLTMRKAWRDPSSETQSSWVIDGAAGALALVGARHLSFAALAYPVYHFASNNAMVAVLVMGRRRRWSQLLAPPDPAPPEWRAPMRAPLRAPLRPPLPPPLPPPAPSLTTPPTRRRRHGAFGPHRYVAGSTGFGRGHVQHRGGG